MPVFDHVSDRARTRVKMCGITRLDDALSAVAAGADAVGFIFYQHSKRYISPEEAGRIRMQLPPFVTAVGVVVNENHTEIEALYARVGLDLMQLHGDEGAQFCAALKVPYVKALPANAGLDLVSRAQEFGTARAILLDTPAADRYGGTGEAFAWRALPEVKTPVIVAGGLHAGNVGAAIRIFRPYAVDVSSGIETGAGRKDRGKMRSFVQAVRAADVARDDNESEMNCE